MTQLIIENNGQKIIKTNFWQTELAKRGGFFLSSNAGAFRLLVPSQYKSEINEFKTAKDIILTRGLWIESGGDAMEILFDDETENPYSLHLSEAQLDRWPSIQDVGKEFDFTVWLSGPTCAFRSKCLYRIAERLPYLKPKE